MKVEFHLHLLWMRPAASHDRLSAYGDFDRTYRQHSAFGYFASSDCGCADAEISNAMLEDAYAEAIRDTIKRFEQTGSPVISDGEQTKPSFATYPLSGLTNLAPDGVTIPFADGHVRQLPHLTAAPFRYGVHAASYLRLPRVIPACLSNRLSSQRPRLACSTRRPEYRVPARSIHGGPDR